MTTFVATNIDDMMLLMLFFARVSQTFRPKHIVAGQYLGFAVLVFASLPGFFGGFIIPRPWLGLLGFVPIAIGISQLMKPGTDEPIVQAVVEPWREPKQGWRSRLTRLLSPQSYQVAAVTVANGGDNISIYVPLFANSTLVELSVILAVFLGMVAVWCGIAYVLVRHPMVAGTLTRYGERLVPFVLIGLGIYILLESRIHTLW